MKRLLQISLWDTRLLLKYNSKKKKRAIKSVLDYPDHPRSSQKVNNKLKASTSFLKALLEIQRVSMNVLTDSPNSVDVS